MAKTKGSSASGNNDSNDKRKRADSSVAPSTPAAKKIKPSGGSGSWIKLFTDAFDISGNLEVYVDSGGVFSGPEWVLPGVANLWVAKDVVRFARPSTIKSENASTAKAHSNAAFNASSIRVLGAKLSFSEMHDVLNANGLPAEIEEGDIWRRLTLSRTKPETSLPSLPVQGNVVQMTWIGGPEGKWQEPKTDIEDSNGFFISDLQPISVLDAMMVGRAVRAFHGRKSREEDPPFIAEFDEDGMMEVYVDGDTGYSQLSDGQIENGVYLWIKKDAVKTFADPNFKNFLRARNSDNDNDDENDGSDGGEDDYSLEDELRTLVAEWDFPNWISIRNDTAFDESDSEKSLFWSKVTLSLDPPLGSPHIAVSVSIGEAEGDRSGFYPKEDGSWQLFLSNWHPVTAEEDAMMATFLENY